LFSNQILSPQNQTVMKTIMKVPSFPLTMQKMDSTPLSSKL